MMTLAPPLNYSHEDITALWPYLTAEEQAELALLTGDGERPSGVDYARYADDPVHFGMDVLGEMYTEDVIRVMESVQNNVITIAESANGVGKTHCAARIATWWYKCKPAPNPAMYAQVYTAAAPPLENLQKLLWGELYGLTISHPDVFAQDRILGDLNIVSKDIGKAFITGVAIPRQANPAQREASFSGKHAPYLLFILDEADAIPGEVYSGIESCMSGGEARLLCMYNPRSDEGPLAALKGRGVEVIKMSAFDHPNVRTGRNIIPGAVTRNKTVHRIHKWTVPATAEYEAAITGYGRLQVPDFLVGTVGQDEETGKALPPLPAGDRIITEPEFCYMVMANYPGVSKGVIYDTWRDGWDQWKKMVWENPGAYGLTPASATSFLHLIEKGTYEDAEGVDWAQLPPLPEGNVSPLYDYEPGAGMVLWAIDDGYVGSLDPDTGTFTAESHPRVILFFQIKPNGDVVQFDELYRVREPQAKNQITEALARPYPRPEFVVIGPGSAALGGLLAQEGFYKRSVQADVEESIKLLRNWVSADENGYRRFKVHPRCVHFRKEMPRYRRDDNGRIIKAYDHGVDAVRYLAVIGRNGF